MFWCLFACSCELCCVGTRIFVSFIEFGEWEFQELSLYISCWIVYAKTGFRVSQTSDYPFEIRVAMRELLVSGFSHLMPPVHTNFSWILRSSTAFNADLAHSTESWNIKLS
jgi:hypothetical protein